MFQLPKEETAHRTQTVWVEEDNSPTEEKKECKVEMNFAVFSGKGIRKTIHEHEWWFSIVDICAVLTGCADTGAYWRKLKQRLKEEGCDVVTLCHELKLTAPDGKLRETDCANTEGILRIIQSIRAPKADLYRRWLAKVGCKRVQEIEDPELATKRTRALYKAKGYSDTWIEKRLRGIAVREELRDEWKNRNVKQEQEHAILTAEISQAAFGVTPDEHMQFKGLKQENLRDHMTNLELIFSMLGEAATTEITKDDDVQGFHASRTAARKGGEVAGTARKNLEKITGKRVVSPKNYLNEPENRKRLQP